jgi:hypothetical protein
MLPVALTLFFAVNLGCSQVPLPDRRLRMIFSAEHKSDLPGFVKIVEEHPGTINIASAYCYSIGVVTENTTLSPDNFCWDYFTKPIQALQPKIYVHPIIQMGGDNAIVNFGRASIFVKLFIPEALKYNYSGYFMDVEFHGDKHYHEAERYHEFLHVFGSALHEHNISLTVLSRSDNSHATPISIINVTGGVDAFVVEESSKDWKEIIAFIKALTYPYKNKAGTLLYPNGDLNSAYFIQSIFQAMTEVHAQELAFFANFHDMGDVWFPEMQNWLEGKPNASEPLLHEEFGTITIE